MTKDARSAPEVLRGVRMEAAPLRLGRARADVAISPAPQALVETPSADEEWRRARAQALSQAREEGLACGHAEGLREGRTQAAEEVRQAVQRALAQAGLEIQAQREQLQRLIQHARSSVADLLWSAQDEIVALCYETLCRMVGPKALHPAAVRAQVAQLMAQHGAPGVVLHVHPADAGLLQGESPAGMALSVVADADVALGGCILRTPAGALDARLDAMLEACKATLLEARAGALRDVRGGEAAS